MDSVPVRHGHQEFMKASMTCCLLEERIGQTHWQCKDSVLYVSQFPHDRHRIILQSDDSTMSVNVHELLDTIHRVLPPGVVEIK